MTTENPRIRTSDAERERVAQVLRDAVGEGRLTLEEGDERLATLYTTKFRDELDPLIADLPRGGAQQGGQGRRRFDRGRQGTEAGDAAGMPWADPEAGQGAGGPGRGGPGWPGPFGRRMRPVLGLLRLAVAIAIVAGVLSLLGHLWFLWIPILFIALSGGRRCAGWRHHRDQIAPWNR